MATILLVEDNEMNRDMLSRRLERAGYRVVTAINGAEALTLAQMDSPDLILMDITLPDMDGWEVTQLLKSDERTRRVPIIALTARVLITDRARAFAVGCDDYDTKPVDFQRVRQKIDNLIERAARA